MLGYFFVAEVSQHRKHVLLYGQRVAIIYGAVEVYGQVRDGAYRLAQIYHIFAGMFPVVASYGHSARYRQRTVEPCVHDAATIFLHVQLHYAAVTVNLCVGLDLEAGGIAVRGNDPEAVLRHIPLTYDESEQRTAVLGHIVPAAAFQLPRVALVKAFEAGGVKFLAHIAHCREITRGLIHPLQQPPHYIFRSHFSLFYQSCLFYQAVLSVLAVLSGCLISLVCYIWLSYQSCLLYQAG